MNDRERALIETARADIKTARSEIETNPLQAIARVLVVGAELVAMAVEDELADE